MTPKYLQSTIDRIKAIKDGIVANAVRWVGQPIDDTEAAASETKLKNRATSLETAKDQVHQQEVGAHTDVDDEALVADQLEKLAIGIHANDPAKLADYDIELPKTPTNVPPPEKAVIDSIKDDVDGEGFQLNFHSKNATGYQIKRAVTEAGVQTADPAAYVFLETTGRQEYVDDAVEKGKRYHYMVRGTNARGKGEWSAAVSGVQ